MQRIEECTGDARESRITTTHWDRSKDDRTKDKMQRIECCGDQVITRSWATHWMIAKDDRTHREIRYIRCKCCGRSKGYRIIEIIWNS